MKWTKIDAMSWPATLLAASVFPATLALFGASVLVATVAATIGLLLMPGAAALTPIGVALRRWGAREA